MRRIFIACVLLFSLVPTFSSSPVLAATASCADFDSWEWAQTVYDNDVATHAALDPDGNGGACDELPQGGFAPTTWTSQIPAEAQPAKLVRIIDGDTFEVLIDGVSNRVRIYRADTPETQNEHQCGGQQATDFATFALGFSDATDGTLYLEKDKTARDKYGRELAYVWFKIDGQPYMLNELLIRSGWADDVDYGDRKYDAHMKSAKMFAQQHDLGVWSLCGAFGAPLALGQQSSTGQVPATTGSGNGSAGVRSTGRGSTGGRWRLQSQLHPVCA